MGKNTGNNTRKGAAKDRSQVYNEKTKMFAKRDANLNYTLEEVNGAIGMNDSPLVATRCYVKSPFEEALYFGGFDPNSNISTNNAWIFKKTMNNLNSNALLALTNEIKIHPKIDLSLIFLIFPVGVVLGVVFVFGFSDSCSYIYYY